MTILLNIAKVVGPMLAQLILMMVFSKFAPGLASQAGIASYAGKLLRCFRRV